LNLSFTRIGLRVVSEYDCLSCDIHKRKRKMPNDLLCR
jgi:hypothetical protein